MAKNYTTKYYWKAYSTDGSFEDKSDKQFLNKRDCYNDMRSHALEKMKWNTEYDADFDDLTEDEFIGYEVKFYHGMIIHESYSGKYIYTIEEVDMPCIPYLGAVRSSHYNYKKHCHYIEVQVPTITMAPDNFVIVAEVYDNGCVNYINADLCGSPSVVNAIHTLQSEVLKKK